MGSNLRPTLRDGDGTTPILNGGTAYLTILTAVEQDEELIHGRLHAHGASCAIGSFFDHNERVALPSPIVEEVAAVNDSVPHYSGARRRLHVTRWLKWKLAQLGMPGFLSVSEQVGRRTR